MTLTNAGGHHLTHKCLSRIKMQGRVFALFNGDLHILLSDIGAFGGQAFGFGLERHHWLSWAFSLQLLRLLSLHNCVRQFFMINLFLYTYLYLYFVYLCIGSGQLQMFTSLIISLFAHLRLVIIIIIIVLI